MNSRLKEAARQGDRELLLSLIHQGADVNAVVKAKDSSALIEASLHGHGDCVRELINLGADLDHQDKHQMTAMWYAIQHCHIYCLQLLVIAWIKKQFGTRKFTLRFIEYTETGNFESINVIFKNPDFQAAWTDDDKDMAMFFLLTYDSSLDVLAETIDAGANINACMTQVLSPVLLAIIQNKPHQLEFLLRLKPEVIFWLTPMKEIHLCTRDNEFEGCMHQLFADKPVNLNSVLKGKTLYMFASLARDGQCLKLLMKYFGDSYVNEIDMQGKTALMYASAADNQECVKMLLDNKADANIKCNEGRTALMYAALNGCFESLEMLAKCEQCLSEGDVKGKTAVMFAAESGSTQCLSLFLEIGTSSHLTDNEGMSALMHASRCGHSDCVSLLISHGISVNDINLMTGESVLMYALKSGNFDCVKVLFNNGLQFSLGKGKGKMELISALLGESLNCVSEMLRHGCHVCMKDNDMQDALRSAINSGTISIVQTLMKAGTSVDKSCLVQSVFQAVIKCNDEMIENLFKLQPGVLSPQHHLIGRSFLMYAALSGSLETVKLFVDHGHDVHEVCRDDGRSVLMYAAEGGNVECVGLLLRKGSSVLDVDAAGCSALMIASRAGYEKCVNVLLEHNARVNRKDNVGRTALAHAAIHGYHHENCMDTLISLGADVNCVDKEGQSPLIYSAKKGDLQAVKILIGNGATIFLVDCIGMSAASYAIIHNHYDCFRHLLGYKGGDDESTSAFERSLHRVFHLCPPREMYTIMQNGLFCWHWLDNQGWRTVRHATFALIKAGLPSHTFHQLDKTSSISILDFSLAEKDRQTSKLLVKYMYMCCHDIKNLKTLQSVDLGDTERENACGGGFHSDPLNAHTYMYCPFTLKYLSSLAVSWNVKHTTVFGEREKMVDTLPISDALKKVLSFRSPVLTSSQYSVFSNANIR